MNLRHLLPALLLLLLPLAMQAQSSAGAPHPKKVYTNDDLSPSAPPADNSAPLDLDRAPKPKNAKEKDELGKKIAADILRQKKQVAELETHLDRLNTIVTERAKADYAPAASAEVCKNEPERCETKREAVNDLNRTTTRLATAKDKLESTQEKARKLGYPSSVWDPTE